MVEIQRIYSTIIFSLFLSLVKRDEGRKAQILFAIVIFFVVCNVPLTILNFEEFVAIAPSYWSNYQHRFNVQTAKPTENEIQMAPLCYSHPFWATILRSISKLLLTLNASVCCFVYCAMCKTFRIELSSKIQCAIGRVRKIVRTN